jgi:hypothetical protein
VVKPADWPDAVPWPFEVKSKRGEIVRFDGTVYEVFGFSDTNRFHVAEPRAGKELARGIDAKGTTILCKCMIDFDPREVPAVQYLFQLIAHYRASHPLTHR